MKTNPGEEATAQAECPHPSDLRYGYLAGDLGGYNETYCGKCDKLLFKWKPNKEGE